MANVTVVENVVDATNENIAVCLDFIKSKLAHDLDALKSEHSEHMAKRDTFAEIEKCQRQIDAGNNWGNLSDWFHGELYMGEKMANEKIVAESKRKIALLREYEKWNEHREHLESEIAKNVDPLRELVLAINGLTGDKTIHKTHIPHGNKNGANGERIHHGNMCQIIDAQTNSIVTYTDKNGVEHETWKSINNACKTLVPREIDDETGEIKPYINQNSRACESKLTKHGFVVKFVAQN